MENNNSNDWITCLPPDTELQRYLTSIKNNYLFSNKQYLNEENVTEDIESIKCPFLSILIRTQGKREDGLREALLCVLAQTYTDYEIILIAHKADKKGKEIIREIIDDQQEEFKEKIRYIEIDDGTRTKPLNVGFSLARGNYISVFDDDDILFDRWAECFYELSKTDYGRILHTYAFSQDWVVVGEKSYRAICAPKNIYCTDFDLERQLINNKCPLMTLAFPMYPFKQLGIIFDEKLNVMEDWDYFMRLSLICGVSDMEVPTAIYRFWKNAESSATLFNQNDWDKTYKEIRDGQGRAGLLIPPKYSKDIIELLSQKYELSLNDDSRNKSKLYYSTGEPFNDEMVSLVQSNPVDENGKVFNFWFPLKYPSKNVSAFRFDLCDEALFILKRFEVEIYYSNGEFVEIPFEDCAHTGLDFFDHILFLHKYPEIAWEYKKEEYIECVHIVCEISREFWDDSNEYRLFELLFSKQHIKNNRIMHKKGLF